MESFPPEIVFLFSVPGRFGLGNQARYISPKRAGGQLRHGQLNRKSQVPIPALICRRAPLAARDAFQVAKSGVQA
jgi:hypothetical protein